MKRIIDHPILGQQKPCRTVRISVNGREITAVEGEMIASVLLANGIKVFRSTKRLNQPRGIFCGIGRCTDCVMTVDGVPNVRTCVTPVKDGMVIETQKGLGKWVRGEAGDK